MLFNSTQFLLFFPAVTAAYFLLPHRWRWALLLAASCGFYMAFVPVYILALFFTIAVDYAAGILMSGAAGHRRRLYLVCSIIANVGLLAFFKYYNFASENLAAIARVFHWNYGLPALNVILPIGLSFHTFQAMSYTIEVYRGRQPAERHLGIYALYVMFYPQLVAGPIERPQNLLHQFREAHSFDVRRVTFGLQRMLWGMFEKVVIADNLAVFVDQVYNDPTQHHGLALITATALFAIQIYCDFNGYCDIALGAAQVMGIRLMENFNRPYFAKSVSEFWHRWHMSLSTWFRDYLYIPLGGSRTTKWKWYRNLFITFLVSGLWHGANYTYVVWGALNAVYILLEIWTTKWRNAVLDFSRLSSGSFAGRTAQVAMTFCLTCLAWVFFRARDLHQALYVIGHLFAGPWPRVTDPGAIRAAMFLNRPLHDVAVTAAAVAVLVAVHLVQRKGSIRNRLATQPTWVRWTVYYSLIFAILLGGRFEARQFIYFQF